MAGIVLKGVSKSYAAKRVLKDLDLELVSGECFTILGPSGCGKTVLLRLIAGFEKPDTGSIRIGERLVADAAGGRFVPPEDRRIGVVFQDYAVWPHKTVRGNVAYPLDVADVAQAERDARVDEAIEQVNLGGLAARLPYQLSGGQQQRVALARAIVAKPELMLLDEPLTNLDAKLREEMRFEIKDLQRRTGVTILYVTHDQEVALAISDRIAIMDAAGRILQVGSPREVYERPADEIVFRFLGVSNFIEVEVAGGVARFGGSGTAVFPALPPAGVPDGPALAAFRPMDAALSRPGAAPPGAPAKVLRATMLGPIVDFLVEAAGAQIRAQAQTEEAIALSGGMLREGEDCRLSLLDVKWFPASHKEAAT
jgi:iron(III) transport system ATP-binding protein